MLVDNKEKRVLGPPVPTGFASMVLKPGVNNVADDAWDAAKRSKFVKDRLGDTLIEIGQSPEESAGLSGMGVMESLELVKATLDLSLLKTWRSAEKRKKVHASIDKQIEILEAGRRSPENSDQTQAPE